MATTRTDRRGSAAAKSAEIRPDRASVRRALYSSDAGTASAIRDASRRHYQQEHPPQQRLANGPRSAGTTREVTTATGHTGTVESYTVAQTALTLGRSLATLRRWLREGKIPAQRLRETSKGYAVYSRGEVEEIAEVIAAYEADGDYFTATSPLGQALATRLALYRARHQF